jgi:hypothetical protein
VTLPVILDQAVDYCSHYFGSGCWLLITLFWTWLLVSVPIILDKAVGSHAVQLILFAKANNP